MSVGLARSIADALDSAIAYLIGSHSSDKPVYQSFFEQISGVDEQSAVSHWQNRLENLDGVVFPQLPSPSYQPQAHSVVEHVVRNVSLPEMYKPASLIQAAWASVQAAHANSGDVWFGTLSSSVAPVSSDLATALPVRVTFDREEVVSDLLSRLQSDSERTSYLNILRIRLLGEQAARACQFQTLLAITTPDLGDQERPDDSPAGEGEQNLLLNRPLALRIECMVDLSEIQLRATFDCKTLEGETVTKMMQQFECALRWLSTPANFDRTSRDIETASDQDLRIIWGSNQTPPAPINLLVHNVFAKTVQRQPQSPAISAWDGELTYQRLDELSTQLAIYLVDHGVGAGSIVPIYIEKSMWTPVAQLAVMKAGGASVLLDSTQPVERARSIATQVKPNVLISSPANKESALTLNVPDLITLDWILQDEIQPMVQGRSLPQSSVASDLLYMVFTSGSTGLPKGAMITHENFASAIHYQQRALGYAPGLRVYDFVSYAFDVTWSNMLHSLTSGACLCIPSDQERKNDLIGSLQRSEATMIDLTPSILRLLQPKDLPQLSQVILSGEAFTKETLGDWANHPGLLNTYGPAECSVKATMAPVLESSAENDIGCGEGLTTWIVDPHNPNRLAPIGAIGELWLEGPLVGRGYLADSKKTAEAFVENPSWLLRGGPDCSGRHGRLYRTGDLVRYEGSGADGKLIFIGRKDSQIKIRGQRVELGEIEYHVRSNLVAKEGSGAVQVLADVLKPRDSANPMLVAFVCAAGGDKAATLKLTAGLDDQLQDKLPAYMIPAAYIPLEHMPVGPTGKTDRRRLREIGTSLTLEQLEEFSNRPPRRSGDDPQSPLTPTEALLRDTWAVVLKLDAARLSSEDHFLRVGGDSILAMRLVGEARERGMSLSVADIFKWPRLADLARELDARDSVLLPSTNQQTSTEPFSLLGDDISVDQIRSQSASLCGVETNQVVDVFPCTPLQVGLLADTFQRAGDNVLTETWLLKKDVNVHRLRAAWKEVVRANPILRTRIVDLGQHGLVQVIVSDKSPESEEGILAQEIGLGTPLVSCKISEGRFSWTIHHALYDGWSMPLIFEALAKAYRSEVIQDAPPFQAFIEHIQNSSQTHAEEFWKNQFSDFDAQNFPVLPSKGYKPKCDEHLEIGIDNITSDGDYTVSTRVRLSWAILLATITDSADASFGAIVSGRQANVVGIEGMTGPTMATVPVRVAIDRSKTAKELLQQVQLQAADTMPFEQVGLQKIRRFSSDCSLGCQFQSLLVIQPGGLDHDPKETLFESSVQTDIAEVDPFKTYAICLEFILKPNGICLRADYDSTVVPASQFRRLADRFENILRQLSSTEVQDKQLFMLDTSSSADRKQIWGWNDTPLERSEQTIHEIFMQVTAKQPDAPAVCSWDGNFTYGQLDDISTRIAHTMLEAGLPQSGQRIVPLFFEKSKWMSVCQIAVMKANGTSVALDATLPDGRLQVVMDVAQPQIVLTSAAQESRARALAPSTAQVIVVSDAQEPTFGLPEDPQLPLVDPDTWIYVVFTSGSTGTPKGAIISHSNFASALKHGQTALKFGPDTRAFDFVSYAFDVSWLNVLYTLCAGGCLCVPSHHEIQNEPKEAISRRQANTGFITPTVGKLLHGSGLKVINYGGENLPREEIDYWKDRAQIIHSYGPSECTPISISHILDPARKRVIIGKGLGVRTWIVEPEHASSISAVGDIGELWLEGPLIGQGYLNDPAKTEAAFPTQPEWIKQGGPGFAEHHARMYRTGDLVRYEEDGNLEFIGRKDAQIKIRGQRVELEEIGHHVHEAIGEAIASQVIVDIIQLADSSERALVAFVELSGGNVVADTPEARVYAQELALSTKDRLSATIPSYMIPNSYMIVDSIPNTTSGKVDRGKLRKAASLMQKEDLLPVNNIKRREPETPEEIKIHALVAQVLNWDSESFGMDNNFIQLGGDSISAMRLASVARDQGIPLTVTSILTKHRIADLLEGDQEAGLEIETRKSRFASLEVADPLAFVEDELMQQVQSGCGNLVDVLPATDMQSTYLKDNLHGPRRSWFYSYIDFAQLLDEDRLVQSCEKLVEHCDIYRTAFVRSGDSFFQAVFDSWKPTIGTVDSNEPIESTFDKFVVDDVKLPASLGAPLLLFKLIRGPDSRARLVFSMSHAIYDAISFGQTFQALADIYNGSVPKIQDFTRYVSHIQSCKADSYSFWRDTLQNSSMTILPCNSPEPAQDSPPTVLVRSVPMPHPPFGITQATLFTFACASVLGRMTSSTDVVLGRVVSGRASVPIHLQNVVGPCLNRLPVRANLTAGENKQQRLAALQKHQAESLAYETTGLSDIVKHCTDWSADTADFGCWIQYQNVDEEPVLDLPGAIGALGSKEMWEIPVASDFLEIFAIPSQDGMLTVRLIGGAGYEASAKAELLDGVCSELMAI
jgi:amino acid adenylation domain-containing protein